MNPSPLRHALTNPANWLTLLTALGGCIAFLLDDQAVKGHAKIYAGLTVASLLIQAVLQTLRDMLKAPANQGGGTSLKIFALVVLLGSGSASAQLLTDDQEARYRATLPAVSESWLQEILDADDLLIYSEREIPRAYQFQGGVHDPGYDIAAIKTHETGNSTVFPWAEPAGVFSDTPCMTFRFLHLPVDDAGQRLPVIWQPWRDGYRWHFPIDTTIGEVMCLKSPDGYDYAFEIRVRTRRAGSWNVEVYRPFPDAVSLAARIRQLRPNWLYDDRLNAAVEHLEGDAPKLVTRVLVDRNTDKRAIHATGAVDSLPPLDAELVAELLTTTPFEPCSGSTWRTSADGVECHAPTTDAAFHVVPRRYAADAVEVSEQSCARCHQDTNKEVRSFGQRTEWYGKVRGSDGILSFHPFDKGSISHNGGEDQHGFAPRMNTRLERAGVIARFDQARHTSEHYRSIEGVE